MFKKIFSTLLTTVTLLSSPVIFAGDLGIKAGDNMWNGENKATFHEIMTPGQSVDKYVEIVNSNPDSTVEGVVIAKDGLQGVDGAYTYIATDQENTQAGTWYTITDTVVKLDPGSIIRKDATITIPAGTAPGEYGSSLAVVEKMNEQIAGNIRIVNRNGIRNLIVVKGSKPSDLTLGNKINDLRFVKTADTSKLAAVTLEMNNVGNLFSTSKIVHTLTGPQQYESIQNLTTDIGPTDKTISINTALQPGNWNDGAYKLSIAVENSPTNRRLTSQDYVYNIFRQNIDFTFKVVQGEIKELQKTRDDIIKDDKSSTFWKPEYTWALVASLATLAIGAGIFSMKKKNNSTKYANSQTIIS